VIPQLKKDIAVTECTSIFQSRVRDLSFQLGLVLRLWRFISGPNPVDDGFYTSQVVFTRAVFPKISFKNFKI